MGSMQLQLNTKNTITLEQKVDFEVMIKEIIILRLVSVFEITL
jgi:hypothetical protein